MTSKGNEGSLPHPRIDATSKLYLFLFLKFRSTRFPLLPALLAEWATSSRAKGKAWLETWARTLGKYDLLLTLCGEDLGMLSRLSYQIIFRLEEMAPASVSDFTRVPAFRWTSSTPSSRLGPVALIQLKLADPLAALSDLSCSLNASLQPLEDDWEIERFGGFGWHESLVILRGRSPKPAVSFISRLLQDGPISSMVSEVSTVPLWLPGSETESFSAVLESLYKCINYEDFGSVRHLAESSKSHLGYVDVDIRQKVTSFDQIEEHLDSIEWGSLSRISSTLLFDYSTFTALTRHSSSQDRESEQDLLPKPLCLERNNSAEGRTLSLSRRRTKLEEKIDATRLQLQVLRNDARFSYLIPSRLVQSLDAFTFEPGSVSESDISGYIATLRQAVHQRLSGTYPAAASGLVTGYADGFGGYQRFTLAAEALLSACLAIMLGRKTLTPPILLLFDRRGLHQEDFRVYQSVRHLSRGAPLIVRLADLKYEPWTWHRGLYDLARWCKELGRFVAEIPLLRKGPQPADPSLANYVARVLGRPLALRLRALEGARPVAVEREDGHFDLFESRYRELAHEFSGVLDQRLSRKVSESVQATTKSLQCGEVVLSKPRDAFLRIQALSIAYYSLPVAERKLPHVTAGFVLSLYCSYRDTVDVAAGWGAE